MPFGTLDVSWFYHFPADASAYPIMQGMQVVHSAAPEAKHKPVALQAWRPASQGRQTLHHACQGKLRNLLQPSPTLLALALALALALDSALPDSARQGVLVANC